MSFEFYKYVSNNSYSKRNTKQFHNKPFFKPILSRPQTSTISYQGSFIANKSDAEPYKSYSSQSKRPLFMTTNSNERQVSRSRKDTIEQQRKLQKVKEKIKQEFSSREIKGNLSDLRNEPKSRIDASDFKKVSRPITSFNDTSNISQRILQARRQLARGNQISFLN